MANIVFEELVALFPQRANYLFFEDDYEDFGLDNWHEFIDRNFGDYYVNLQTGIIEGVDDFSREERECKEIYEFIFESRGIEVVYRDRVAGFFFPRLMLRMALYTLKKVGFFLCHEQRCYDPAWMSSYPVEFEFHLPMWFTRRFGPRLCADYENRVIDAAKRLGCTRPRFSPHDGKFLTDWFHARKIGDAGYREFPYDSIECFFQRFFIDPPTPVGTFPVGETPVREPLTLPAGFTPTGEIARRLFDTPDATSYAAMVVIVTPEVIDLTFDSDSD